MQRAGAHTNVKHTRTINTQKGPAAGASSRLLRASLARAKDRVGVEAVVAVQVGDVAGLAEGRHAERRHGVAVDRAEPREGERMAVEDGDEARGVRHVGEQPRDVRGGAALAPLVGQAVVRRHLRRGGGGGGRGGRGGVGGAGRVGSGGVARLQQRALGVAELPLCGEGLGRDDAGEGDHDARRRRRPHVPVAALR